MPELRMQGAGRVMGTARRTRFRWWVSVVAATICFALNAPAQIGGKGALEGTVSDATGAVVPQAKVVATDVKTGVTVERTSTGGGYFVISPLNPGEYTVTVSAEGFETFKQEHITLNALQTQGLEVKLNVGSSSQTVTISDAPPSLETENATLGGTMQQETYEALPLNMNNGKRDPTAFAYLLPGVQSTAGVSGLFNGSGSRGGVDEIYLEGIAQTKAKAQGDARNVSSVMSVDSVEQFQVVTSAYPVEYAGMGVQNYIVKRGTNSIHGSAFEYFRNTALDTWGYFAKNTINPTTGKATKPAEHQNEFGVTLGGPILKDKLFFFGSYDVNRYSRSQNPGQYTVPTAAARAGDFTAYGINIYDPLTTDCTGG